VVHVGNTEEERTLKQGSCNYCIRSTSYRRVT